MVRKGFLDETKSKWKKSLTSLKKNMSITDRNIVATYSDLLEGLSSLNKMELIESLSKSLKVTESTKDSRFYKSFGAFDSERSAEEIIADIKSSRKFRTKKIKF
ncbi:MAG: hypothetical protein ABIR03_05225 [Ginsengibacter sp.]